MDAATGSVLYERSSSQPRIPASTLKILTGTAVTTAPGADSRITTRVVAGPDGSVILVGGGDPDLPRHPPRTAPMPSPWRTWRSARPPPRRNCRRGNGRPCISLRGWVLGHGLAVGDGPFLGDRFGRNRFAGLSRAVRARPRCPRRRPRAHRRFPFTGPTTGAELARHLPLVPHGEADHGAELRTPADPCSPESDPALSAGRHSPSNWQPRASPSLVTWIGCGRRQGTGAGGRPISSDRRTGGADVVAIGQCRGGDAGASGRGQSRATLVSPAGPRPPAAYWRVWVCRWRDSGWWTPAGSAATTGCPPPRPRQCCRRSPQTPIRRSGRWEPGCRSQGSTAPSPNGSGRWLPNQVAGSCARRRGP